MNKSPDAFRTISEVADVLETPAHVLRFWESRFPQIRPVKRAGGRRYYRPADVALLTGIKRLLHDEGMTIRGVQKILREQGVRFVSGVSDDSSESEDDAALIAALSDYAGAPEAMPTLPPAEAETAQIIALQSALREPLDPEYSDEYPADDLADDLADDPADDLWQGDAPPMGHEPEAEDAPAPDVDEEPAKVAEPPAPVTIPPVTIPPVTIPPVYADLFARLEGPASSPTPEAPAAPPTPDAAEAPMAVWAEDTPTPERSAQDSPDGSPPPVLKITRIGANPAPATPMPPPQQIEGLTPPPTQAALSATMAQRLRATAPGSVSSEDRRRLSEIRDTALALRTRLSGSGRVSV
jgi:resuscitation-promoting factor RpfA